MKSRSDSHGEWALGVGLEHGPFPYSDQKDVHTEHESKFPRRASDSTSEWRKWTRDGCVQPDMVSWCLLWIMSVLRSWCPDIKNGSSVRATDIINWARSTPRRRVGHPDSWPACCLWSAPMHSYPWWVKFRYSMILTFSCIKLSHIVGVPYHV